MVKTQYHSTEEKYHMEEILSYYQFTFTINQIIV